MSKVSIISSTYNDCDHLRVVLNSILRQSFTDYEVIVVDGGSKDGTIQLLESYESRFKGRLKWSSEPDKGIYDALNKGIARASGEIIGCCYDEFLYDDVLADLVQCIDSNCCDGVHADLVYTANGKVIRYWRQGIGSIQQGWMPGHPTLYLKRWVYVKYGNYRTDYRISADYEFMIRILKDGHVKLAYLPKLIISMTHGGTSTNGLSGYWGSLKEAHRALVENGIPHPFWIDCRRTLRLIHQFMLARKIKL